MSIKSQDIDAFMRVRGQMSKLHSEISILSKSKPDAPINRFKLQFVNQVIQESNQFLRGKFRPFEKFESFDEDELPTYSDIVLILSQYLDGCEAWRCANIYAESGTWYWKVPDAYIATDEPSRYRIS